MVLKTRTTRRRRLAVTGGLVLFLSLVVQFAGGCLGFVSGGDGGASSSSSSNSRVNPNFISPTALKHHRHGIPVLTHMMRGESASSSSITTTASSLSSSSSDSASSSPGSSDTNAGEGRGAITSVLFRINSSTKWIVTVLNTVAVWSRPHRYEGPCIVFGSILAVYFTNYLKTIINQGRPEGAPFTDPGMPSSHSVTCFFLAAGWSNCASSPLLQVSVWFGAAIVAWLRVVCGYHTWAQIGVGALIGSVLGTGWTFSGHTLYEVSPTVTLYTCWSLYICGAAYFISTKIIKDWMQHEKHL